MLNEDAGIVPHLYLKTPLLLRKEYADIQSAHETVHS